MTDKITAETRTEFGKGAARRIRRDNKIPAVIYGHGMEPQHLTLPGHDTWLALKHGGNNALLELTIEGKTQLALTKQIQVDSLRRVIEHIDFVAVVRGEKVTVDVPVHVVGDAQSGTIVVTDHANLHIEAEATHIPEFIEVSIEGAEAGTVIHASDLVIPKGVTLLVDDATVIVKVTEQVSAAAAAEADAAEAAEAAGDAEPAEAPEAEAAGDDAAE